MKRTQADWLAIQAYIIADATEALILAAQMGNMAAVRRYAGQVERAQRLHWLASMTHRRWDRAAWFWSHTAGARFGRGRLPA